MSQHRQPHVYENQRIVPLDFYRLSDNVEDVIAWVVQTLGIDPTDTDVANHGIVLYGLSCTTVAGPAVQIAPGAALVPDTGGDRKWRLVVLTAATTLTPALPGAGTRADVVELGLEPQGDAGQQTLLAGLDTFSADVLDATSTEEREFRRINEDAVEEVYTQNVATYRRPTALLRLTQGVIAGSPASSPGFVRLHVVNLSTVAITSTVDWRRYLYPVPDAVSGGTSTFDASADTKESGKYYRGARTMLKKLAGAVNRVINVSGELRNKLEVADGGSAIELILGTMLLGTRSLLTDADVTLRHLSFANAAHDDPLSYGYGPDELGLERLCRASINVRFTREAGGNVTAVEWCGFGVEKVVIFVALPGTPAHFEVYFNAAVFTDAPDLTSQRYQILAFPLTYGDNYTAGNAPDADQPVVARVQTYDAASVVVDKDRRAIVYSNTWDGADFDSEGMGYSIRLYGPVDGPAAAAWTAAEGP